MPLPPLSRSAERALRTLARLGDAPALADLRAADLMLERARLLGLTFRARRSPGGFCRLLDAGDGAIAVNLPRASDWELLPAWVETEPDRVDSWDKLSDAVRGKSTADLQDRARLLGIPAAASVAPAREPPPFFHLRGAPLPAPDRETTTRKHPPLVVDLSSLWAGPLCGQLLRLCGAEVIKVESVNRPDGGRQGNAAFYALLNQGKRSVAFDFHGDDGCRALHRLIRSADIVIEASRPRALRQLGVEATRLVEDRPGLTWVSITGYGREEPQANWVAFGDDAAVAAGLSRVMADATGELQIVGDALADPLTGIQAALAAWRSWQSGGGRLIALALADVTAASLAEEISDVGTEALRRALADWWRAVQGRRLDPSGVRTPTEPVQPLGADTEAVLAEAAAEC